MHRQTSPFGDVLQALSTLLHKASEGGPTAAAGVLAGLEMVERASWATVACGGIVAHWSSGHQPQPRDPLRLRVMLALCKAGVAATGAIRSCTLGARAMQQTTTEFPFFVPSLHQS